MFDIQTIEKLCKDNPENVNLADDIGVTIRALVLTGLIDAQYHQNRLDFLDKSGTWEEPLEDLAKRLSEFRVKQGLLTELKNLALLLKEK